MIRLIIICAFYLHRKWHLQEELVYIMPATILAKTIINQLSIALIANTPEGEFIFLVAFWLSFLFSFLVFVFVKARS